MKKLSLLTILVIASLLGSTHLTQADGTVCYKLENRSYKSDTYEIHDRICESVKDIFLEKYEPISFCSCADNINKADIDTRLKGNQGWTRIGFINSGDTISVSE